MHIPTYIHICMYVYTHIYMCVCVCARPRARACMCVCARPRSCVCVRSIDRWIPAYIHIDRSIDRVNTKPNM